MNCPVCDRKLAPTLSICPACGAMMHDSVREELQPKVVALRDRPLSISIAADDEVAEPKLEMKAEPIAVAAAPGANIRMSVGNIAVGAGRSYSTETGTQSSANNTEMSAAPAAPVTPQTKRPVETRELHSAKTSPTLVGFQNRNAVEPDWKIQLRSAVQKRRGVVMEMPTASPAEQPSQPVKTEARTRPEVDLDAITANAATDPRVAKALERIGRSKQKFAAESKHKTPTPPLKFRPAAFDERPVSVASRLESLPLIEKRSNVTPISPAVSIPERELPVIEPIAFRVPSDPDTNKLPAIDEIVADPRPSKRLDPIDDLSDDDAPITMQEERFVIDAIDVDEDEYYDEDLDDLAPMPMRLGAGLFDLIFAMTGTGLVLLPLILFGMDVTTAFGIVLSLLAFMVTTFVYCTIGIAFFKRTVGMRLFGLELVDASENEPPTLKQSAVSSALFVGTLLTAGLGFATIPVNPERRAFHDIVSGTILVREF